jgi:hypothetical protein
MKKIILVTLIFSFSFNFVKSQRATPDVLASAGDYYTSSTCNVNWTLGEISIESFSTTSGIFTQGFNQPDIYFLAIKDNAQPIKNFNIYPNPSSDYFNIEITGLKATDIYIDLVDLSGKKLSLPSFILKTQPDGSVSNQYNISSIASGAYILHVYSHDDTVNKTYKLIKY